MTREGIESLDEIAKRIHVWNPRKQRFTLRQIRITADRLGAQGWLSACADVADRLSQTA